MNWKALKYTIPLLLFIGAWRSFLFTGIVVWLPVIFSFILLPLLELLVPPHSGNLTDAEEAIAVRVGHTWLFSPVCPDWHIAAGNRELY